MSLDVGWSFSAGAPVNFIITSAFRLFFFVFVRLLYRTYLTVLYIYLAKENTHTSLDLFFFSTYMVTYILWPIASVLTLHIDIQRITTFCNVRTLFWPKRTNYSIHCTINLKLYAYPKGSFTVTYNIREEKLFQISFWQYIHSFTRPNQVRHMANPHRIIFSDSNCAA